MSDLVSLLPYSLCLTKIITLKPAVLRGNLGLLTRYCVLFSYAWVNLSSHHDKVKIEASGNWPKDLALSLTNYHF